MKTTCGCESGVPGQAVREGEFRVTRTGCGDGLVWEQMSASDSLLHGSPCLWESGGKGP